MSIRLKTLLWMNILVLLICAAFGALFYSSEKTFLAAQIDEKLRAATLAAHHSLPQDFHDAIGGEQAFASHEFNALSKKFDALSAEMGLLDVWSVLVIDPQTIRFTAATSRVTKGSDQGRVRFFARHNNPASFEKVLKTEQAQFLDLDEDGLKGRAFMSPMTDALGRTYIVAATIDFQTVQGAGDQALHHAMSMTLLVLLIAMMASYFLGSSFAKPLDRLAAQAKRIMSGDFSAAEPVTCDATEINELARGISSMRDSISSQMARLNLTAQFFNYAAEAIVITDTDNRIIDVNPSFTRITGYSRKDVLGSNPNLLSSGVHDEAFYALLWQRLIKTGQWTGEIWDKRKNGEIYPKKLSISAVHDDDGTLVNYVGIFSDVSDLKQAEDQLIHQTMHDDLTGIANRVLYRDRLVQMLAHAKAEDEKFAVLFIDIDHFKIINDTHGHGIGDEVIKVVASRLKACIRETDTLARMGGDEFTMIISAIESYDDVKKVVQLILEAMKAPIDISGVQVLLSTSVGVSVYPQDGQDYDSLITAADAAMYEAKSKGRDRYCYYGASTQQHIRLKHAIQLDLRQALQNNDFELYYQPKFNIITGELSGFEALIRWNIKGRGLVSPALFIPVAEENGLIIPIGEWVLETAARKMKELYDLGFTDLTMGVNLSPMQFVNHRIVSRIETLLGEIGLPSQNMELEITEGVMVNDSEGLMSDLRRAHNLGMSIAIDDFGTGYSSLAYLKRYPVDCLKIDRTFVKDLMADHEDRAIVEAVISMAKILGLKVLAEGVETQEQLAFLKDKGCEYVQGYYFSKPMSEEDLMAYMAQDEAWAVQQQSSRYFLASGI